MARRHVMTARRRVALRKAQLASARKRKRSRATKVIAVGVLATGSLIAGKKVSNHVKLFKDSKEFQSSGFDPESGYGPGRSKYTYKEHLGYRRSYYKSERKRFRREVGRIVTGKQSKHPLMNGLLVMQVQSGQYKYRNKPQKLIRVTKQHHQRMLRYKSDPTL